MIYLAHLPEHVDLFGLLSDRAKKSGNIEDFFFVPEGASPFQTHFLVCHFYEFWKFRQYRCSVSGQRRSLSRKSDSVCIKDVRHIEVLISLERAFLSFQSSGSFCFREFFRVVSENYSFAELESMFSDYEENLYKCWDNLGRFPNSETGALDDRGLLHERLRDFKRVVDKSRWSWSFKIFESR
jgi:hypothetical protein